VSVVYFGWKVRCRSAGCSSTGASDMGMAVRAPTLAALVTLISGVAAAQGGETLSGSGVVISAKGEILTNAHVVEACQTITLKLASGPSRVHLVLARRGLPSRLRASRGTLPGPSRSRISMKPRRRGGSPSRRAISIPSCRQMLLHRAACAWSIWRSCLRTDSGARRCPWRHDRAVAFGTPQARANNALGAPANNASAMPRISRASEW